MKYKSKPYLSFIHTKRCVVSGCMPVICHHVRSFATGGMGMKPPDTYTVPMNGDLHDKLHRMGERLFWEKHFGIYWKERLLKIMLNQITEYVGK